MASVLRIAAALVAVYLLSQLVIWAVSPSGEEQARRLVEQVQRQGPKQMTPELRLERAELQGRQLRLVFSMEAGRARALDPVLQHQHFRRRLCSDAQTREVNEDLAVVYAIEADGHPVHRFELSPRSCA